jgi:hypothetical protein
MYNLCTKEVDIYQMIRLDELLRVAMVDGGCLCYE